MERKSTILRRAVSGIGVSLLALSLLAFLLLPACSRRQTDARQDKTAETTSRADAGSEAATPNSQHLTDGDSNSAPSDGVPGETRTAPAPAPDATSASRPLPDAIPLPKGARLEAYDPGSADSAEAWIYTTTQSPDELKSFYGKEMPKKGWQAESGELNDPSLLNYRRGNEIVILVTNPDPEGDAGTLAINYFKE